MLNDPAIVQIAAKGETADTVEQYIAHVPHTLKPDLLAALLKEQGTSASSSSPARAIGPTPPAAS